MHKLLKRSLKWGGIIGLVAILAIVVAGCQGEAGPPGTAGVNAAETCSDCHNDTTLVKARQVQWEASVHATGGNFERNGTDCAYCHTSEGFIEGPMAAGSLEVAMAPENPSPQNCRTCHEIHETYTSADWALTTTSPVTLLTTGDTYDQGKSNLCASCHQPRQYDWPIPKVGGGDVEITTSRYGPHYGPQSSMLLGVGGYGEYTGSKVHYDYVSNGCVDCHMADAYGAQAGGHTMKMGYEYHDALRPNLAACESCHSDIESFDRNGVQSEVAALDAQLEALLIANGLITESGSVVTQTVSSAQAGAIYNWKWVHGDGSNGIHNPAYTKFLLQTAIDALE